MVNNICICGHFEEHHKKYRATNGLYMGCCITCFSREPDKSFDHLHEFKLDNLRFLESVVYQKGLEQYNKSKRLQTRRVN